MHLADTWQLLPGLVEYNDNLSRGGSIGEHSAEIKFGKNTYLTLIFQPNGVHSGTTLPEDTTLTNNLIIDAIHTIKWKE
jgi:hypothetical protein